MFTIRLGQGSTAAAVGVNDQERKGEHPCFLLIVLRNQQKRDKAMVVCHL